MIFCGDENFIYIANVNVYRYGNLLQTEYYIRKNFCLVINVKQNRFEIR